MGNGTSNLAHSAAAYVGVLVAAQAPVTAYVLSLPVPVRVADLAVGAFGLFCTLWKAKIDSQHSAAIAVATIAAGAAPAAVAPVTHP
jgi:hypothetical protein